ncbi:glycoside hydrolase family 15 protein [Rhodoligotrophos ferricapiens]|uniref:glycoside hydrolase family 15 protein n=1 Tax=Rhodoligotrophos ferricapiens TaxID=3069264 RepID=UPI00315D9C46
MGEHLAPEPGGLTAWMDAAYRFAAGEMLKSISATGIIKERPGFGQTVIPKPGSVLASPVLASYDPDPDYFFHWLRDSAIVMDALCILITDGTLPREALQYLADFIAFSADLSRLDGRLAPPLETREASTVPDYRKFLRASDELAEIHGDRVLGDVRFNPDGTLDITQWARPQNDGPALRALTLMRARERLVLHGHPLDRALLDLLKSDLAYICRHWREPSVDFWEEELNHHYAVRLVQLAAAEDGASVMDAAGESALAQACRDAALGLRHALDEHWSAAEGFYRSRLPNGSEDSRRKHLDIATILAVIHAERHSGPHSVLDPRAQATLSRLENLFTAEYKINQQRRSSGPAMGRYLGDHYYSGGAYYFSTLAAAEFYYRLSAAVRETRGFTITPENRGFAQRCFDASTPSPEIAAQAFLRRGDDFMETVRAYTPESLELSEQFDQSTGEQTSAKRLTWSYAALITAIWARREASA